jgi:two-component system chemotaxis response regulator CheY
MRRIIRSYLEKNRVTRIAEAGNGRAAMDLVKFQPLDLIVSDLNMPVMNGMELLEALKADPVFQKICFIMLTVEAIQKTMNQALVLGADSYIVKPVTEIVFIREIKAALAGADHLRD